MSQTSYDMNTNNTCIVAITNNTFVVASCTCAAAVGDGGRGGSGSMSVWHMCGMVAALSEPVRLPVLLTPCLLGLPGTSMAFLGDAFGAQGAVRRDTVFQ